MEENDSQAQLPEKEKLKAIAKALNANKNEILEYLSQNSDSRNTTRNETLSQLRTMDQNSPPELRLPKFDGLETCLTFNFNGDPKAALALLSSARIMARDIVSKNVCHGVIYNQEFHECMKPFRNSSVGLNLIYNGMELYLRLRPEGKMFHDPLAACITVNRNIAKFQEVEIYRKGGEWGAHLAKNTNTFITVTIDHNQFFQTFTQS